MKFLLAVGYLLISGSLAVHLLNTRVEEENVFQTAELLQDKLSKFSLNRFPSGTCASQKVFGRTVN